MRNVMLIAVSLLLVTSFASADGLLDGDGFASSLYLKGMCSWVQPDNSSDYFGYDDGWYAGGGIGVELNDYLALEFEGGYYELDADEMILGVDVGGARTIPLLVNAVIGFPATDIIYPYATIGFGAGINNWEGAPSGIEVDIRTSFIGKFGIGCDFSVTESIVLFVEGSYLMNEADAEVSVPAIGLNIPVDNEELSAWLLGGGVKFFF